MAKRVLGQRVRGEHFDSLVLWSSTKPSPRGCFGVGKKTSSAVTHKLSVRTRVDYK